MTLPSQPQRRWPVLLAGLAIGVLLASGGTVLAGQQTSGDGALRRAFVENGDTGGWFRTAGTNSLGEPNQPEPVLTQTAGSTITCGVGSTVAAAAAADPRWVRIENEGVVSARISADVGATTSSSQLMLPGDVVWRYTYAQVSCLRVTTDATVTVQLVTQ